MLRLFTIIDEETGDAEVICRNTSHIYGIDPINETHSFIYFESSNGEEEFVVKGDVLFLYHHCQFGIDTSKLN